MPEHVHLIVWPREPIYDIADIRRAIKSPVASKSIAFLFAEAREWIPRITRKRGQKTERCFWQSGGGYDRNVVEPATLMKMIDYIHMNPARRGLVEKPEDWFWSSAAWYLKMDDVPIAADPIPPEWGQGGGWREALGARCTRRQPPITRPHATPVPSGNTEPRGPSGSGVWQLLRETTGRSQLLDAVAFFLQAADEAVLADQVAGSDNEHGCSG